MIDYYYEYDDEGDLVQREYTKGDIVAGVKGTLPSGRYVTVDDCLVRIGNASGPSHYSNTDSLGQGTQGVFNPADGKTYDSKSAYYNAVKAKGLVIDDSTQLRQPALKLNEINWEKSVKETLNKLSPTRKGKKK
jgi:hypothetical protein